ncbi:hypothetical protein L1987_63720 [Smallanthus sonchifolius]|uniref:Uncharacterized protein n=1 Tax=Smallanthus sonchifolius TaxID=185202 RepID=A0ACB9CE96_9ASTR|nr:hypothetical protein L1987_63720 [Smallanthus sonchifolius]
MSASMDALETPVGLGAPQEELLTSAPQPLSVLDRDICNLNKELSAVPSVTVSLDASEHNMDMTNTSGSGKASSCGIGNTPAGKIGLAGKTGLAGEDGLSASDSSGSPGVHSMNDLGLSDGLAGFGSARNTPPPPPVTPLFSLEFKAMILAKNYMTSVFKPRDPYSGEVKSVYGLWGGMASTQVMADGLGAMHKQGDEDLRRPHSEGLVTDLSGVHVSSDVQAPLDVEDLVSHLHVNSDREHATEVMENASPLDVHVQRDGGELPMHNHNESVQVGYVEEIHVGLDLSGKGGTMHENGVNKVGAIGSKKRD